MKPFHSASQPNCKFNVDADTTHRFGYALWAPVNFYKDFPICQAMGIHNLTAKLQVI